MKIGGGGGLQNTPPVAEVPPPSVFSEEQHTHGLIHSLLPCMDEVTSLTCSCCCIYSPFIILIHAWNVTWEIYGKGGPATISPASLRILFISTKLLMC